MHSALQSYMFFPKTERKFPWILFLKHKNRFFFPQICTDLTDDWKKHLKLEKGEWFIKHQLPWIEHKFFINYFCPQICTDLTDDWKKHLKPRLWWLRSIDLTCCPSVLCLKASFCTARKYITVFVKTQPSQRQKHKKGSAHGWIGSTHFAFFPASLCARLCRFRNEMEKESAASRRAS